MSEHEKMAELKMNHPKSLALLLVSITLAGAEQEPGVITTNQIITPAGGESVFRGRVYGVAFGATSADLWALTGSEIHHLDGKTNKAIETIEFDGVAGMQGIQYDAAGKRILVSGSRKDARKRHDLKAGVRLFSVEDGMARQIGVDLPGILSGAPSVAANNRIVVPLTSANAAAIIDSKGNQRTVAVGKAPFAAIINRRGDVAYVSNWGGRVPLSGDITALTGLSTDSDRLVVDDRGIASTGTVSRIDLETAKVTATVPVGLHPTAMVWDEPHSLLYVANGNDDTVSVIDTEQRHPVRTFPIHPFSREVAGIAPTALALSPDGAVLYVACGGINAVALIETASGRVRGLIPTGWYPSGVSISNDGRHLAVSTLLGIGSGSRRDSRIKAVGAVRGTVHVVEVPDDAQLASYTTAVAENNHMTARVTVTSVGRAAPAAIPARAGEPSPIEHVVYIIKENRTYDQILGDIGKGNSDPSLTMYGAGITPNQHRLANEFVLLDNFYANGGNSGDGHQWLTQANETDYCLWPGYVGRSYPFDGTDPLAYARNGFLWDAALRRGRTVRVFGEYAGSLKEGDGRPALLQEWKAGADFTARWKTVAPLAPLNKILAPSYPPFSLSIPDVVRVRIFLNEFAQWQRDGRMPNLTIIQLPSNHTRGTTPGTSTPKAMVADNDLALGQIVDALSKSRFWKKMAIFVVEDDAQDGVDHVDGHRTIALAISPYSRRGSVDATMYSQASIVKTIELILGLPSLSIFDLIANPMSASFINNPDFGTYTAVIPEQSLFDLNPALSAVGGPQRKAAADSAKMRFDVPDAVPSERLNRILWHAAMGCQTPYPEVRRAALAPHGLSTGEEER
jgi:YVTN family beta-propeller protein